MAQEVDSRRPIGRGSGLSPSPSGRHVLGKDIEPQIAPDGIANIVNVSPRLGLEPCMATSASVGMCVNAGLCCKSVLIGRKDWKSAPLMHSLSITQRSS